MDILFAPNYTTPPYQSYLSEALKKHGVDVHFYSHYKRVLPLYRAFSERSYDALHLHWPEAYFNPSPLRAKLLRKIRYPLDLWLTRRKAPLFLTAHNLYPHNRKDEFLVPSLCRHTYQSADLIFAHSERAIEIITKTFSVPKEKCVHLPFGDLSYQMGEPMEQEEARKQLALPKKEKTCLVIGAIRPYKGIDSIIKAWNALAIEGATLYIVGKTSATDPYSKKLRALSEGQKNISLHFTEDWVSDSTLKQWICSADCMLFNYDAILSSGAAPQARSFGVPILIPKRLDTVDLGEPHPSVFRFQDFETDFQSQLQRALERGPDPQAASKWREYTSWKNVAKITAQAYQRFDHEGAPSNFKI